MNIDIFQYVITIITAITALIVVAKKIITFFIDINPINSKLKKYNFYKKEYSKYYPEKVNNYLDREIRKLSLTKLTTIKDETKQRIYFDIVLNNQITDNNLLIKLINLSYIDNNSIKIWGDDLKRLNIQSSKLYHKLWFAGVLIYFISIIILSFHAYYKYETGELISQSFSYFIIPTFLFYGLFWAMMIINNFPLNKDNLKKCLHLLKENNTK